MSPAIADTLAAVYPQSPTIRALVRAIEESDVIVHVVALRHHHRHQLDGMMQFGVAAGGVRFLRVAVDEWLPPDRRAAILGHELQHAVEVAREPSVIDPASFARFYRLIGEHIGSGEAYETAAGPAAATRVREEIRTARHSNAAASSRR